MSRVVLIMATALLIGLLATAAAIGSPSVDAETATKLYVSTLREFYAGRVGSLRPLLEDERAERQHSLIRKQFMTDKDGNPYPNLDVQFSFSQKTVRDDGTAAVDVVVDASFDRQSGASTRTHWVYAHSLVIGLRNGGPVIMKDAFVTELDGMLVKEEPNRLLEIGFIALMVIFLSGAVYVLASKRTA